MTRFLPESGALFQHIPRTGGTFVEDALTALEIRTTHWTKQRPGMAKKHALLSHYHRKYMPDVKLVVAFVRHPVNYYASVWKYMRDSRNCSRRRLNRMIVKHSWHPFRRAGLLFKPDFCEWMEAMLEDEPAWATRLMSLYVGPEGGEFCRFIGRTETLESDLIELLIGLGCKPDPRRLSALGRVNASVCSCLIPDDLRERICREERVLIRRFYGPETSDRRWYGV